MPFSNTRLQIGNPTENQFSHRLRGDAFRILSENKDNGIRITPKTPIPAWLGEKMDEDLVIFHLTRLE